MPLENRLTFSRLLKTMALLVILAFIAPTSVFYKYYDVVPQTDKIINNKAHFDIGEPLTFKSIRRISFPWMEFDFQDILWCWEWTKIRDFADYESNRAYVWPQNTLKNIPNRWWTFGGSNWELYTPNFETECYIESNITSYVWGFIPKKQNETWWPFIIQ